MADVLDADVDALLHVLVADLLVQNDAHCGLGHVVYDTSLAMIDFVGLQCRLDEVRVKTGFKVGCRYDRPRSSSR